MIKILLWECDSSVLTEGVVVVQRWSTLEAGECFWVSSIRLWPQLGYDVQVCYFWTRFALSINYFERWMLCLDVEVAESMVPWIGRITVPAVRVVNCSLNVRFKRTLVHISKGAKYKNLYQTVDDSQLW